ncbi:hypothetical protein GCM10023329_42660 [Streptomyces sanyensis]|uniref:Uncharacterized protein n=1 Tax=Streptomyces sanyensis TaxID=568869 RepID=A0ABP9AZH7_9ACTN
MSFYRRRTGVKGGRANTQRGPDVPDRAAQLDWKRPESGQGARPANGPPRPPRPPRPGHGEGPVGAPPGEGSGADRVLPHRTRCQAEQEVVLQVELEVEVELVLVQPASTTSLASE